MTHPDGEFLDFDPFRTGDLSYKSANFSIERLLATANVDSNDPELEAKRNFAAVLLTQYVNDIPDDVIRDDAFSQKETFNFHRVLSSLTELVCDDPTDQQETFELIHALLKIDVATPSVFIEEDFACTGLTVRRPYLRIRPHADHGGLGLGMNFYVVDEFPGEPIPIEVHNLFSVNFNPAEAGTSYREVFFGKDIITAARATALNTMYRPETDTERTATLYHAKVAIDAMIESAERISDISSDGLADLAAYKRIIDSADFNHRLERNPVARRISTILRKSVVFDPNDANIEPIQGLN